MNLEFLIPKLICLTTWAVYLVHKHTPEAEILAPESKVWKQRMGRIYSNIFRGNLLGEMFPIDDMEQVLGSGIERLWIFFSILSQTWRV